MTDIYLNALTDYERLGDIYIFLRILDNSNLMINYSSQVNALQRNLRIYITVNVLQLLHMTLLL